MLGDWWWLLDVAVDRLLIVVFLGWFVYLWWVLGDCGGCLLIMVIGDGWWLFIDDGPWELVAIVFWGWILKVGCDFLFNGGYCGCWLLIDDGY